MKRIFVLIGSQGLGDTLCAIPAIKHLSIAYNEKIHVFTYHTELLKNYPYITLCDNYTDEDQSTILHSFRPDIFLHNRIDIRQMHALSLGFQLLPEELNIEFYPDEYQHIENLPNKYVVIHPSKSWTSRTWEKERWQELVDNLNKINIPVVSIGKDSYENGTYHIKKPIQSIDIKNGLNLIDKLNIHQTWHVLHKSEVVVTMDSGILHLAGTTNSHILQLGSSIDPRLRAPYRKNRQDYKYSYIMGTCKKFCGSDMRHSVSHNSKHNIMPPIPFCLENPGTIGVDTDPDPNIYLCHPSMLDVFNEIVKIYNFFT